MTAARLSLVLLLASVALVSAACGGGSDSVPTDAVAVVDGTEISKAELAEYMELSKKGFARTNQQFPKAGTPEYQDIQTRNLGLLVQLVQFQQAAEDLGIEVTDKDVDKLENETIKSKFEGDRAEYEKALKKAGYTPEQYRRTAYLYAVLSSRIFEAVTKDVKVTEQDVLGYYTANQSQYGTPETREVRHILIAEPVDPSCKTTPTEPKDCPVDFAASKPKADEVYAELQGGADFATLAKKLSADSGSAREGGKLTVTRGQTVPEFDKTAFELDTHELSKPVKTQFGYHLIEPISDPKKATVQPFDKVKASIRVSLLQQKRNDVAQKWIEDQKAAYEDKVSYAVGYAPPEVAEAPTETQ